MLASWERGHSLATEAATAALFWADTGPRWPRTLCIIDPENAASLLVAAKCGFTEQARTTYRDQPIILFARKHGARAVTLAVA